MAIATKRFGAMCGQRLALDFGCGVGRLVIPLTQAFDHVTGVDISPAMLEVAERNCLERGIRNANFVRSDAELTQVSGTFDFIHSYLVFQRIPRERGERLMAQLLNRLSDDGVLAIHVPFMCKQSAFRRTIQLLRANFRPFSVVVNVARRKPWDEPFIQMNMYDVNRIFNLLSECGIKDVFSEVVEAGGFVSAFVFAKKPAQPIGAVRGRHLWDADLEV